MIANFKLVIYSVGVLTLFIAKSDESHADLSFSMGVDYEFVSCNSIETLVCDSRSNVIFSPLDYHGVGPISDYALVADFLLLKTSGRIDSYSVDFSKRYFFAISGNNVNGPYSKNEFEKFVLQKGIESIKWKRTHYFYEVVFILLALVSVFAAVCFFLNKNKGSGALNKTD